MIGASIAHYTITAKLGAGGRGEVWRATDTKLGRDVALKIIPEVFTQDPQRMARFQREAQLLASLNHANIAAIYGVEEAGGHRALVLELVEGEDLHERLRSGPIPIEETLDIARQIAEALEAAHDRGVIHRDLKPANVRRHPPRRPGSRRRAPHRRGAELDQGHRKIARAFAPSAGFLNRLIPSSVNAR